MRRSSPIGCTPQTLLTWVRKHERDSMTTVEHQRVKQLERENKALHRANEILKLASAFFAQAVPDQV